MDPTICQISGLIESRRLELTQHPVYSRMSNLRHVQTFMEHHVYAVWDFMSLLKALQRKFGCFRVPWTPSAFPAAVRLLNDIALAEESDVGLDGECQSHFGMYREAMRAAGASTAAIDRLVEIVDDSPGQLPDLESIALPESAKKFVDATFGVISRDDSIEMAATFLYGREDLLPGLFTKIVAQVSQEHSGRLDVFLHYLQRHIEVDEGEHGPAAERLLEILCDGQADRIDRARLAASDALRHRMLLWDGILADYERNFSETVERTV